MERHQLDQEFDRLRTAADRIVINLAELDQAPVRELLDTASLTGVTAERWAAAQATLRNLFQSCAALTALLERAATLKEPRLGLPMTQSRLAQLADFLLGPSIEFRSGTRSLVERELLASAKVAVHITPDELLTRMAQEYEGPRQALAKVTEVWNELVPRLVEERPKCAELRDAAAELGLVLPARFDVAERALGALGETALTDPLAVDRGETTRILAELDAATAESRELLDVRMNFSDRIREAREWLATVAECLTECRRARDEALSKFQGVDLEEPPADEQAFERRLDDIGTRAARGHWDTAVTELTRWRDEASGTLRRSETLLADCRALLEERHELRGRLDAFLAKAGRLGRLEEPDLAALHDAARDALFSAPTDLARAGELVRRYQQALLGVPAGTVES